MKAYMKKKLKGPSAQYMTRSAALRKTQLQLAEFRRLCILKGIYPREPKKKLSGPNQTYYHAKDIRCINHDPIVGILRQGKAYDKKIKKAIGRKELSVARHYKKTKPTYTLHHIVKERYPSLLDAVRDLDDPLTTLSLFAVLPAEEKRGTSDKRLAEAVSLVDEFHFLVSRQRLIKKAFASIKGFYFQAEVMGHMVTWLVPHQYTQEMPFEVDFRVMLTFLEFYTTLVKFVNFKLFSLHALAYPPVADQNMRRLGGRHLALISGGDGDEPMKPADLSESAPGGIHTGTDESSKTSSQPSKSVFESLTVFISREIPLGPLSMVLLSGGATIGWDSEASPVDMENPSITHQLVDRSAEELESLYGITHHLPPREYIQPQWALDCLNNNCLLPTSLYQPGATPPPHLSPFVDDVKCGYVPKQRELLDAIRAEKTGTKTIGGGAADGDGIEGEEEEEAEAMDAALGHLELSATHQKEIEKEKRGHWFSHEMTGPVRGKLPEEEVAAAADALIAAGAQAPVVDKRSAARKKREKEELDRRAAMMSNRKKRLKTKLEEEDGKVRRQATKLVEKRKRREAA